MTERPSGPGGVGEWCGGDGGGGGGSGGSSTDLRKGVGGCGFFSNKQCMRSRPFWPEEEEGSENSE